MRKLRFVLLLLCFALIVVPVYADKGLSYTTELSNTSVKNSDTVQYKINIDSGFPISTSESNSQTVYLKYDKKYLSIVNITSSDNMSVTNKKDNDEVVLKYTAKANNTLKGTINIEFTVIASNEDVNTDITLYSQYERTDCSNNTTGDCSEFYLGSIEKNSKIRNINIVKNVVDKTTDQDDKSVNQISNCPAQDNMSLYISLGANFILLITVVILSLKSKK